MSSSETPTATHQSAITVQSSIADQVAEFNAGFNAAIGPRLAAVFAEEQDALNADGVPAHVVSVGDSVPNLVLTSASGAPVDLYESLGDGTSVVIFYRGSWCPYCNLTLKHYQQVLLPQLQERGVQLVAISPQTPEASELAIANGDLEYVVLSDPANRLITELGILTEPTADARAAHTDLGFDVADSNADATGNIPFPTVLVIDADRRITFADVHVDYTTRTEVPQIIAALG